MSDNEALIALLDIRSKLATSTGIRRNTLRYRAMQLAARFVDPSYEERPAPPLRCGAAMAVERDIIDGVPTPF